LDFDTLECATGAFKLLLVPVLRASASESVERAVARSRRALCALLFVPISRASASESVERAVARSNFPACKTLEFSAFL
jgi:hypothetical protein